MRILRIAYLRCQKFPSLDDHRHWNHSFQPFIHDDIEKARAAALLCILAAITMAVIGRIWGNVTLGSGRDLEGGRYCFYYGFDQYSSEVVKPETVQVLHPEKEYVDALKTVRLQIYKRDMNNAPLMENTAEPGSNKYYDMGVRLYVRAVSPESGQELMTYTNGYYETNYCSNNFADCKWFTGITPEDANRYSDDTIKQEYSAEQLLGFYQQGLKLQEQLTELYNERRRKKRTPRQLSGRQQQT